LPRIVFEPPVAADRVARGRDVDAVRAVGDELVADDAVPARRIERQAVGAEARDAQPADGTVARGDAQPAAVHDVDAVDGDQRCARETGLGGGVDREGVGDDGEAGQRRDRLRAAGCDVEANRVGADV
jgi:hypothetical protein